jgi:DHA2 family multidrug resistance protein-like MFS transporter
MTETSAAHVDDDLNPKRWAVLGVLVIALLVVVLDNTVLNVALPTIARELDASQEQLIWSINAYSCMFAALLFTWGVLGDRYGRKRILVIGLSLFGLASLLTAYAQTPLQLILFRGVMGAAGASVLPVTLAIITVVFPPRERGKAIGLWAAAVGAAVAIGPVLGGFLIEHFWWGSVFLINVPIVIVGVIAIAMLVPESKNPKATRLDPAGVVLSISGLLLLTYGILHGGDTQDWLLWTVSGPVVLGVALLTLFVFIEKYSDHPSLDLSLFKIRSFVAPLTAVSLAFAAMSGSLVFLTFYLQTVRGWSPLESGLFVVPVAIGQIIAAPRSQKMVARFGARKVVTFGLVVVTLVFLMITQYTTSTPAVVVLVVNFFLGFGLGNTMAPCTTRMTLATPPERSGAGSAVQNTVRQVGASLGVAIVSSVVATLYANKLGPSVTDLPAASRTAALDDIQSAAVVAQKLGGTAGQALIDSANTAFLHALHWAAILSALMTMVAAVVILWRLPAEAETVAWEVAAPVEGRHPVGVAETVPEIP